MTRRIAIAILLTTWAALLAGSVVAYLATRYVLLTDMDAAIVTRAMTATAGTPAEGDRYIVRDAVGRTLARLPLNTTTTPQPQVVKRTFTTLAGGQRQRTLTLRLPATVAGAVDGAVSGVTIVYSSSAERFDVLLNRLAMVLAATCAVCGALAAVAAGAVSRVALRPLRQTAEAIGAIDDRHLDRRIGADELPPELRPMASRLNEMLARLQAAFEQRHRFLAAASHELRTPVAAMLTTIEVALRRPRGTQELSDALRARLADARALRHLVNWLMQQVRGESNDGESERFDVVTLFNEVADAVSAAADAPGRTVTLRRALPAQLFVTTEPMRLRSILSNLLTNAFEYCGLDGQVELTCAAAEATGPSADLVFSVSDNGPGIAPEFLPHLFEPFARGPGQRATAADNEDQHLGLGLSLVKAHVDALGGHCEASNATPPDRGAVFRVRLPGVVDAAATATVNSSVLPAPRSLEVVR